MNNAINMLPCPMCGCSSINVKNEQPTDNSGGYFIECPDCGISTSLRYACGDDPIPLLAEQWNRRATAQCLHQIAEPAEQSATYGMHFGDRVLHIGGRENAAGYIEFGSVEAVRVLVGQVLRDLPGGAPGFELAATHPTQQGLTDLRWQIVHDHVSGEYIAGRACFVVQIPPLPGASIMRGSVAEHFTKAVDAIAAQAKQGAE